jgi:hypothetical protein
MSVDHGRGDLAVAEELLDGADVLTALPKVGREGVTEGVATGTLVDAGRADGSGHGALHVRLVVMVPALGGLAPPSRRGGKDPLPAPVAGTQRGTSARSLPAASPRPKPAARSS